MTQYQFDEHYVEALRFAMQHAATRAYVFPRIDDSLHSLGLNPECATAVISLLSGLTKRNISGVNLAEQVSSFQEDWRLHLDRVYLNDYEGTRWNFMSKYVFGQLKQQNELGRCLDVGCGRGCATASLVREKLASAVVGIDAADFTSEWRERASQVGRAVRFEQIQVSRIEDWLQSAGQFDTILLLYVLHHCEEYWAARTLRALQGSLRPGGRLIVLEDSLALEGSPLGDNLSLTNTWRDWAARETVYCLTAAYDAQVILDFVAVQLLAGFWDVRMPCNYRTTTEWERCFRELGYQITQVVYIGFPEGRDIDVPQALFVLRPPHGTGDSNADQTTGAR